MHQAGSAAQKPNAIAQRPKRHRAETQTPERGPIAVENASVGGASRDNGDVFKC